MKNNKKYIYIKRIMDFFAALLSIIVLSPLFLLIALLIKCVDKEEIFFRQLRPGKAGRVFTIYKFKTMRGMSYDSTDISAADSSRGPGVAPDSQRLTGLGRFLRKTSLDELPQLLNVLRGDMSFIGPRPLLVRYLKHYSALQMRRHEVLPGISGWAQVNGRNSTTWEERLKLDVWYVDHISFKLDVKILLLTIKNVFNRKGINNSDSETMPFFDAE